MDSFSRQDYGRDGGLFDDDEDEEEKEFGLDIDVGRELLVYMIDASSEMFLPLSKEVDDGLTETYFSTVVKAITKDMKTRIISREKDELAVCFFNTREKRNFQDSNGVFVFQSSDQDARNQDELCQPTARLIKDFSNVHEVFNKTIGTKVDNDLGSRENPLYNALWVAQGLLRKGSVKNSSKRILIFTNKDDPFSDATPASKRDMRRTTIQRARDAQDLGISIEIFPFSKTGEEFNVSTFYADMVDMNEEEKKNFMGVAAERCFSVYEYTFEM